MDQRAFVAVLASILMIGAPALYAEPTRIHLVYMGGDDCPPCVAWRQVELPKLQESAAFKSIQFSYVTKTVQSAVPSGLFLPAEVKPLKEKLDIASGGNVGSPQAALIVNDVVYDYWVGPRAAAEIEKMIVAVQSGTKYPFQRCTKRAEHWQCIERVAAICPSLPTTVPGVALGQVVLPLPKMLSGCWKTNLTGGGTYTNSMSVVLDVPAQPGPLTGRLTVYGFNCGAADEPLVGNWDGSELRFESKVYPDVNAERMNGPCGTGLVKYVLTRKPGQTAFEGESLRGGFPSPIQVLLVP